MDYIFTLKYRVSDEAGNADNLVERLGAAGCDDALIGIGQAGRIALEFTRGREGIAPALRFYQQRGLGTHCIKGSNYLKVRKYASKLAIFFSSLIPQKRIAVPGTRSLGPLRKVARFFSDQTIPDFFIASEYLKSLVDAARRPTIPFN
jgi:hypothetical protein